MKKTIILIIILTLTGCIKNNISMKLETNKNFNITIINGYQTTSNSNIFKEEEKQKIIDNGYKLEDYKEDNYTGIKISLDVDNIDSISDSNVDVVELTNIINIKTSNLKLFKKEKRGNKTLYIANFTYNLSVDDINEYTTTDSSDIESYKSILDLKYSITLPVEVENSNCTDIDGNTYIWQLELDKINEIKFSFIIDNTNITREKTDYETNTKSTEGKEINNYTKGSLISTFIGIGIFGLIIYLYYYLKKKIANRFKKKKKKKGYHFEAPESVKEKK